MPLFAVTLLVGAALLFCVQPMVAKSVLPLLGGAPAVWNTCMVFFQSLLLAGYAYAHATTSRLGVRRQAILHVAPLVLPLLVLPIDVAHGADQPPSQADPTAWLLRRLLATVGLPFFAVSATAPLLQRWFAETGHPSAEDPYFLYGASNLGSMLALLVYPTLIEPNLGLARQSRYWSIGYMLLAVLVLLCAVLIWRSPRPISCSLDRSEPLGSLSNHRRAGWVALAFIPSSLMLGVTTYLATDIASVPLLWVIPLALYLLTFILVFARRPIVPHAVMVRLLPIAVMLLAPALAAGLVQVFWVPLHLLTFFAAAMVCHGELGRRRPAVGHLTAFYLAVSIGGVLGGIFNALVAPVVFDRVAEYPLAIVLALLAVPAGNQGGWIPRGLAREVVIPFLIFLLAAALLRNLGGIAGTAVGALGVMIASGLMVLVAWTHRSRPVRFALAVGAVLLASGLSSGVDGRLLYRERSFFGVARVTQVEDEDCHRLFHGSTLHGQQCLEPSRRREPLTYFTRSGPIGQVFEVLRERRPSLSVAVVGLGAGTLACYAEPGDRWTFYEIDPVIARIARDPRYFTYLADCRAGLPEVILGDARLRLRDAPAGSYDLIVLDAFSSDAAPTHLLTREALRLYRRKLAAGGLLAFNLSSRYLDLDPVLGALARDAGLIGRIRHDLDLSRAEVRAGKQPSIWAVLAARAADLGPLADDPRWQEPRIRPQEVIWTDDFSDIVPHLLLRPRRTHLRP
ncbi:MAG: fused MFS/spermidine synthase [Isosphaeraceae bacterium]|nr:fused MFS/spermidine synthase [Isosphaeraceae bacterium]